MLNSCSFTSPRGEGMPRVRWYQSGAPQQNLTSGTKWSEQTSPRGAHSEGVMVGGFFSDSQHADRVDIDTDSDTVAVYMRRDRG
jgi:hypothetical protein